MFEPGNRANPQGRIKNNTTQMLRDAIVAAGKTKKVSPFKRIAELFYKSDKMAIAILPYLTPKLRTLEVSGEVSVPFQFIIETSAGVPVTLPQPRKEVASSMLPGLANSSRPQVVATTNKPKPIRIAKSKLAKPKCKPTARKPEP